MKHIEGDTCPEPREIEDGAGVTFVYRNDPVDGQPEVTLTEHEVAKVASWARRVAIRDVDRYLKAEGVTDGIRGAANAGRVAKARISEGGPK